MKRLMFAAAAFAALSQAAPALALTLEPGDAPPSPASAQGLVSVASDFVIAGFGPLPAGLEARLGTPSFPLSASSALAAPDAAPLAESDVTIAGGSAADPSIYTGFDQSTRNGGSEGARGDYGLRAYGVFEIDVDADGTSDISELGVSGETSAQVFLSSQAYDADGAGDVTNRRPVTLINMRDEALTFGLTGSFELSLAAAANGAGAEASAEALVELFFRSDLPLDIVFAPASPILLEEDAQAPGSFASLELETDVAGTGRLALAGAVSALSPDFGAQETGTATGALDWVLGVTLAPGQEVVMLYTTRYRSEASFRVDGGEAAVPLPGALPLLAAGLAGFGWLRGRRARV